jgi:hypothetical protein
LLSTAAEPLAAGPSDSLGKATEFAFRLNEQAKPFAAEIRSAAEAALLDARVPDKSSRPFLELVLDPPNAVTEMSAMIRHLQAVRTGLHELGHGRNDPRRLAIEAAIHSLHVMVHALK